MAEVAKCKHPEVEDGEAVIASLYTLGRPKWKSGSLGDLDGFRAVLEALIRLLAWELRFVGSKVAAGFQAPPHLPSAVASKVKLVGGLLLLAETPPLISTHSCCVARKFRTRC